MTHDISHRSNSRLLWFIWAMGLSDATDCTLINNCYNVPCPNTPLHKEHCGSRKTKNASKKCEKSAPSRAGRRRRSVALGSSGNTLAVSGRGKWRVENGRRHCCLPSWRDISRVPSLQSSCRGVFWSLTIRFHKYCTRFRQIDAPDVASVAHSVILRRRGTQSDDRHRVGSVSTYDG